MSRVLDVMLPYNTGQFGNPHSMSHSYGWSTEEACEKAREVTLNFLMMCEACGKSDWSIGKGNYIHEWCN